LSFNDVHFSKSISLVDLDLGKRGLCLWGVLKLIRFFVFVKKAVLRK